MSAENDQNVTTRERPFRVADWHVDPACGCIARGGEEVRLEPRVMDVLVSLAGRAGKVVTREELEEAVWAGRVVGYDALTGAMQKLRKALEDDPRQPRIIETLSKKGYRLIAAVEPADEPGQYRSGTDTAAGDQRRRRLAPGVVAVVLLLVFHFIGLLQLRPWQLPGGSSGSVALPVSIAVLPFDNLNGDPEQEYFADGMTDDLITELAKDPTLLVIARDSAFFYKGQTRDVREVAERLHVRYILSGSVRRAGEQLRLNAQLTDTATGSHLWAEHYDGTLNDVFALQDRIADQIVLSLATRIGVDTPPVRTRQEMSSPEAYDYFLHGRNRFFLYASREENRKARDLYQKAIDLDPDFATAYAMLAWTYVFEAMNGWSPAREDTLLRGQSYAARALALDNTLPIAYFVTGLIYREQGKYEQALVEAKKAIALEPNYANAHVLLATLLYYTGRPQEGLERIKKAMRLNPHHPYNYPFHLGQAYFILGRYREAIGAFEKGLASNPSSERLHVWLAAAYAQSGRREDARWEFEQVITLNPGFSLERIRQAFPFRDPADLERFLDGLRLAGFAQ